MLQPQSIASLVLIMFNEIEAWNMSMNITWHYILMTSVRSFRRFLSHVFKNNTQTFIFTSNKKISSRPRKLMSAL